MRSKLSLIAAVCVGILVGLAPGIITSVSAGTRESPPECNEVALVSPSGALAWVKGCGGSPNAESVWQDQANGKQVIMDGTKSISPAACPKSNPCVLIWEGAPPS